ATGRRPTVSKPRTTCSAVSPTPRRLPTPRCSCAPPRRASSPGRTCRRVAAMRRWDQKAIRYVDSHRAEAPRNRNHGDTPMRSVAIVGGGHAGLQLGIGLLDRGYAVTVQTDRTPDDVRTGRILSSQGMQRTALQHERDLGLAFWDDLAPPH